MGVQERLTEIKDKKSYSSPAKRIMDHLKPILSKSGEMKKRWMWELMQNATDLGDSIKMKIEICEDKLIFSHNGKPFTLAEAFDLIMPDSSKDENRETKRSVIGQFGTGFLSTHILSKIIEVSGIVEDNGDYFSFEFTLDRSQRTNKVFLIESIKKSEKQYKSSLKKLRSAPSVEFQTHFTYLIDQTYDSIDGQEIVDQGLITFKDLIPYVMTFRPQIEELLLVDHRVNSAPISFKREEIESDIENLILVDTVVFQNGNKIKNTLIGKIVNDEAEIAFPLRHIKDDHFRVNKYPSHCPKLFCAFPMIGTKEHSLPFIINSEHFEPNIERDGIDISEYDQINRDILVQGKDAYLEFLKMVQDYYWLGAYQLCHLKPSGIIENDTKKWFEDNISDQLNEGILKYKLIELDESLEPQSLENLGRIYIPYVEKSKKSKSEILDKIFNVAITLIPDEIPSKSTFKNWYSAIDFSLFQAEKLDLKKLCHLVDPESATVEDIAEKYQLTNDVVIDVFRNLTELVIQQGEEELLNQYSLIITQSLKFKKLKGLKIDKIKGKVLTKKQAELIKDIYWNLSGSDIRDELINKDFESIKNLLDEDDSIILKDFVSDTDSLLRDFEGSFKDEDFLLTLRDLFSWYSKSGISESLLAKLMPYFTANKSQLYLSTKNADELEYAFDIEISGKSEVLARIAKSEISKEELEIIANNSSFIRSFISWSTNTVEQNPNKELGNIGEKFIFNDLKKKFGEKRVIWKDASEYDFIVLEKDIKTVKYYIDAKTTGKGIANADNVPFFMQMAQWNFLDAEEAKEKYIIARVFKKEESFNVKYLKLDKVILSKN